MRRRQQRTAHSHFCLIVNPNAAGYRKRLIDELVAVIRDKGHYFTFVEAASQERLLAKSRFTLGLSRSRRNLPPAIARRGKFTGIICCGGDGTFNLAARLALQAKIPVGILPMGETNDIARSYYGTTEPNIPSLVSGKYRQVDVGRANKLTFFGSIGIGYIPTLVEELQAGRRPHFSMGWSRLANRVSSQIPVEKLSVKVDSFLFEASPLMINVNICGRSAGLPITPPSEVDDGQAEVVFDQGGQAGDFGVFTRLILKRKYFYGDEIRLYRGRTLRIEPVKGRRVYLDGELLTLSDDELEINIDEKALRLFSR